MKYDLETVKKNLAENPQWTMHAIKKLYEFQTADEQQTQDTKHVNGKGFTACDAKTLSYYAKWINSGKKLSGKHLEKAQKMVPKYAKQIFLLIKQ